MSARPYDFACDDVDSVHDALLRHPRYRKLLHRYSLAGQLRSLCNELADDMGIDLPRRNALRATAANLEELRAATVTEMDAIAEAL